MRNMRPEFWALEKLFLRVSAEKGYSKTCHTYWHVGLFSLPNRHDSPSVPNLSVTRTFWHVTFTLMEVFWRKKTTALWVLRWFPSSSISTRATTGETEEHKSVAMLIFVQNSLVGHTLLLKVLFNCHSCHWYTTDLVRFLICFFIVAS